MNAFVGIASAVIVGVLLFGLLFMVVQEVVARHAIALDRPALPWPLDRIYRACVAARAQGIAIRPGIFGVSLGADGRWEAQSWADHLKDRRCCPLGAVLIGHPVTDADPWIAASRVLGVSSEWAMGFTAGFDGGLLPETAPEDAGIGFVAGQRLRTELADEGTELAA